MQWADVAKNWPAFTESIVARWPEADAETVADMDPDRGAFETYIAGVSGIGTREAAQEVARWLEGPKPVDAVTDATHTGTSITDSAAHIPVGEDVYSEDEKFGDDTLATNPVGRR